MVMFSFPLFRPGSRGRVAFVLCTALFLTGCYDAEERAENYFQSGQKLAAVGDDTRALLEFRNVFKHDGQHEGARRAYAEILTRQGDISGAYSQYLRLIEQYPNLLDVRQILAQTALRLGNWEEVRRHAGAAIALDPEEPINRNLQLVLDYYDAVQGRDAARRADLAATAEVRLEQQPDSLLLRRVVIDMSLAGSDPTTALPHLELALQQDPQNFEFHTLKLRVLNQAGRNDAVGAQLRTMVDLFPQDERLQTNLLRWYLSEGDQAGALSFLRQQAGALDGDPEPHVQVVQFLQQTQGPAAARAELERLRQANEGLPHHNTYAAFIASMDFAAGKRQEALQAIDVLLKDAPNSDQTNDIRALQAQMYLQVGDFSAAQKLVVRVLEDDPTNVAALKLRARWAIADDRTNDAILDLRAALSQAPRDPSLMTLLAAAHERDGNKDLTGEQLSKAVEASGAAPEESLRYARFLLGQGRTQAADTVLTDANRVSPGSVEVLSLLGEVMLQSRQWGRAGAVADTLAQVGDALDNDDTRQLAERMRASALLMQNRIEEGLNLLEQTARSDDQNVRPTLVVALTQIRAGKTKEARVFLDQGLERFPDAVALRLLSASLYAVMGEPEKAEPIYRQLIEENPDADTPVRLFYGFLQGEGRGEEASALLTDALTTLPDNATLLVFRAGELEQAGDIEATIEIYEQLYAQNSGDTIIANNLASMLATFRQDPESLERAYVISRRLRGAELPHFQDTYGWVQYRRNNLDEALSYLEPAAAGLTNDPVVQFHLGMVYADLDRKDEAIAQFKRALELGEGRLLPQLDQARARIQSLTEAKPETE